uniref:Uncharacterized protein n=1 Tax=Ananas comosus var. bracteatus TaxID=296719 RepID=A0A6V7QIY3_ANACO|nr:unnamed protein product [Ananas comosus var. bracteatus]
MMNWRNLFSCIPTTTLCVWEVKSTALIIPKLATYAGLTKAYPDFCQWGLVDSSGECRDKPESRWRQIDAKRIPCDARAAFCVKICEIAGFLLCCTGTRLVLYRYNHHGKSLAVPVQGSICTGTERATELSCSRFGLVPVQQSMYRYKGVAWWRWSTVEPGIRRRRAASRSSERLLPGHCEEAGRGCVFAVLDIAPRIVAVENLPSTVSISARSPRRSVGSQRNLVHWILDCERIPRSPHLQFLDELGDRSRWSLRNPAASRVAEAEFAARKLHSSWSLIELDRDTLHTRLGSAHECHSGVRLVLLRWCRSCQLDLLSTDQLEWIEPDSRNGAGTGVFTVPGTEPQIPAAASSADQDRGKGVAS